MSVSDLVAVAVPCIDRPGLSLRQTVANIERGGFGDLHLSTEPTRFAHEYDEHRGPLHVNPFPFGLSLHLYYCWRWILERTSQPWLMVVENDVRFCPGAGLALERLIQREAGRPVGVISLFTPVSYADGLQALGKIPDEDGWVDYRPGYFATAGQCQCIHRDLLRQMMGDSTWMPLDHTIGKWTEACDLANWYAVPSLAQHVATYSTVKKEVWDSHVGLKYDDERGAA